MFVNFTCWGTFCQWKQWVPWSQRWWVNTASYCSHSLDLRDVQQIAVEIIHLPCTTGQKHTFSQNACTTWRKKQGHPFLPQQNPGEKLQPFSTSAPLIIHEASHADIRKNVPTPLEAPRTRTWLQGATTSNLSYGCSLPPPVKKVNQAYVTGALRSLIPQTLLPLRYLWYILDNSSYCLLIISKRRKSEDDSFPCTKSLTCISYPLFVLLI